MKASILKKVFRGFRVVIVNLVIFGVLAELLGITIYFFKNGHLFYTQKKEISETYRSISMPDADEKKTRLQFHPYFGFIERPGNTHPVFIQIPGLRHDKNAIVANNYGFHSQYDYPLFKTNNNQYIIGVFGGSVSIRFVIQAQDNLIKKLKRSQFFTDKEIIVLSFGNGGYKQPQHLQVLSYFMSIGQEFDLVINIDGFNEVALSNNNNKSKLNPYMPSGQHIFPMIDRVDQSFLTPEKISLLDHVFSNRQKLIGIERAIDSNFSAAIDYLLKQYYKLIFNRLTQQIVAFDHSVPDSGDKSMIYVNRTEKALEDQVLFEQISQNWIESSMMMKLLLDGKGIPYFHILQPNQYYSKRKFNTKEKKIAINKNSPYKEGVEKGYPLLVKKSSILRKQGINFFSGLDIFDREFELIYLDDCCHYGQAGNRILADFIASSIIETMDAVHNNNH